MALYTPGKAGPKNVREVYSWVLGQLRLIAINLNLLVIAAYGGILKNTSTAFNPSTTWTTIPEWTAGILITPRLVEQEFTLGGLDLLHEGVYVSSISLDMTFNNDQAGRSIQLRLFNVNKSTSAGEVNIYVGRNQEGLFTSLTFMSGLLPTEVGDLFVVQLRSDDVFTASSVDKAQFSVNSVSEIKGT
jgi:hypothetical protein